MSRPSPEKDSPQNRRTLLVAAVGIVVVGLLAFWIISQQGGGAGAGGAGGSGGSGSTGSNGTSGTGGGQGGGKVEIRIDPDDSTPVYERIEAVLQDKSISDAVASERLLAIAADSTADSGERLESLEHGLLLAPDGSLSGPLLEMMGDPDLPIEIADSLVDHLHDSSSEVQVRGCLEMVRHSSPQIQTEAMRLLAFALGAEEREGDLDYLLKAGSERLAGNDAEPPSDP